MKFYDVLGYIAGFLTATSFVPQAYKVFKTGKTNDLSLGMYTL